MSLSGKRVLLLGHGAGGGFAAPDLRAATAAALDAGLHVGLVEQPYRVAGRPVPAPAAPTSARAASKPKVQTEQSDLFG